VDVGWHVWIYVSPTDVSSCLHQAVMPSAFAKQLAGKHTQFPTGGRVVTANTEYVLSDMLPLASEL